MRHHEQLGQHFTERLWLAALNQHRSLTNEMPNAKDSEIKSPFFFVILNPQTKKTINNDPSHLLNTVLSTQ